MPVGQIRPHLRLSFGQQGSLVLHNWLPTCDSSRRLVASGEWYIYWNLKTHQTRSEWKAVCLMESYHNFWTAIGTIPCFRLRWTVSHDHCQFLTGFMLMNHFHHRKVWKKNWTGSLKKMPWNTLADNFRTPRCKMDIGQFQTFWPNNIHPCNEPESWLALPIKLPCKKIRQLPKAIETHFNPLPTCHTSVLKLQIINKDKI